LGSAASKEIVTIAMVAAIFHLFTHAFFKALLFLSAGSVMHTMGNVIDMRRFGGLRHVLPTTHWTFLCGALSLAAIFPLSGFWSKDEILAVTVAAVESSGVYRLLFFSALLTAALTAFYTFRAYFLTFWGQERLPPEAGEHVHEAPQVMLVPMIILAIGAIGVGLLKTPVFKMVGQTPLMGALQEAEVNHWLLGFGSSFVALLGITVAWWMYVGQPGTAGRLVERTQALYQLSLNKFHLDELYDALIVQPLAGFAAFCRIIDLYVVDSLVDLLGQMPRLVGQLFRPIQNGLVQFYALAMALGLAMFLLAQVLLGG
jgi:NADH-quinone oxidoreductase subunit L